MTPWQERQNEMSPPPSLYYQPQRQAEWNEKFGAKSAAETKKSFLRPVDTLWVLGMVAVCFLVMWFITHDWLVAFIDAWLFSPVFLVLLVIIVAINRFFRWIGSFFKWIGSFKR
jgi:hypothetical protein